jgi:hypothetical protein
MVIAPCTPIPNRAWRIATVRYRLLGDGVTNDEYLHAVSHMSNGQPEGDRGA